MSKEKLKSTVRQVMMMLIQGDYDGLERLSRGRRLNSMELREAVYDYGGTLIMPPDSVFEDMDIIEVEGAAPKEWDVRTELWTAEEGSSDLTLELTLRSSNMELYDVQIDNLHVL